MKNFKTIGLVVLVIALALVGASANAAPKYSDAYKSDYNATNPQTIPPILDVLVIRPLFLAGGAISAPIFLVTAPFIALSGKDNVVKAFEVGPGQILRAVFVDPVGSH